MVNWMIELVYLRVQPILHWDHQRLMVGKLREYAKAVTTNGGDDVQVGEGIFRFIDGTVCPIAQPLFNQEIFYSGWKRIHTIKFQGIMAPDGIIMHVSGPYTAKHHDMWMLHQLGIEATLTARVGLHHGLHVYGDAGYIGNHPWIIHAARNGRNNADLARTNYLMSKHRICVEWGYRIITK